MPEASIGYEVSMLRAHAHYFDVSMEVPLQSASRNDELRLAMPVWTPGHYLIEDYSRHITEVKAFDAVSGAGLQVSKLEKSLWSVAPQGAKKVRVEYPVYAFDYSVTGSYIDNLHALINGASLFLYAEGMQQMPIRVKLVPKEGWKVASTGLERVSDWEFSAPNYDILVDSPFEVGNHEVRSFNVGKAKYEVSIFGTAPVEAQKFVGDLKGIVENTTPVFGQVPYAKYVFLVNFTDTASGGLEHLNSTMCFTPRFRLVPKEEYDRALSLYSHEFFHTWNVKRLRPAGLGPFDYTTEVYTKSLWVAEGITSYYDDLILRRSGVYSREEYLDALVQNFDIIGSLPGSRKQSAEEASFDSWTKFYRSDENAPNVTSSYYEQGAVIGWMLDMAIRKKTGGTKSLDNVMRKVYHDTYVKENRGYGEKEFEEACIEFCGKEAEEIFDSRVRGREDVDYDRYLGYVGLKLGRREEKEGDRGYLGVRLNSEGGRTTLKNVLSGSPAEAMGLAVNDEVLAADGFRVGSDKLSFYIGTRKPAEGLRLTITRNGRILELKGEVGKRPAFEHRIRPLKGATAKQKALFKGWTLTQWKSELKYPDYQRSPDRKIVFDYI